MITKKPHMSDLKMSACLGTPCTFKIWDNENYSWHPIDQWEQTHFQICNLLAFLTSFPYDRYRVLTTVIGLVKINVMRPATLAATRCSPVLSCWWESPFCILKKLKSVPPLLYIFLNRSRKLWNCTFRTCTCTYHDFGQYFSQ